MENNQNIEANIFSRFLIKIQEEIAGLLKKPMDALDFNASFLELGIDSILGVDLVEALNKLFDLELGPEVIFDYRGAKELAEHIASLHQIEMPEHKHIVETSEQDIAIIGISGKFAGSETVEEYWTHLQEGHCCIKEIEREGWDEADYYDPDPAVKNKSISKWGGFLKNIDTFDSLFFNISPQEARRMDPQQRLFLEEAFKAAEDSGYSIEQLSGKQVGVFVGARSMDYKEKILTEEEVSAQAFLGNDMSILAARASYYLNLKGPNLSVDTACSSSLFAIHLACESIRRGECDMALAGAVFLVPSPEFLLMASSAGMLSHDDKCKTFNEDADGMVVGEGVGAVMLKPLENSRREGDHIYGVIKGSVVNHNGRTQGITVPSTFPQKELIGDVFKKTGIHPETVSYLEAQGTGTNLGDTIEIKALTEAFRGFTPKKKFCAIGSHTPNMGHAMTAAGIAGLFKILMALKYRKIPPFIGLDRVNPHINFENSPFYINTTLQSWNNQNDLPLRAGISSFGFNGTNCHLIIEEAPTQPDDEIKGDSIQKPYYVIPFSAKVEASLHAKIQDMGYWLEKEGKKHSIADIAYTLQAGRSHFPFRSALIVKDRHDLGKKVREILKHKQDPPGVPDYVVAPRDLPHARKKIRAALPEELLENANNTLNEETYKDKLSELAELYVKGCDIDWEKFNQDKHNGYCRLSLPGYPFLKKRYWIAQTRKTPDVKNTTFHPLIDRINTEESLNHGLVLEKKFQHSELILKAHQVLDKFILPGVGYLEMAAAAANMIRGAVPAKLSRVVWLQPLVVQTGSKHVRIIIKKENELRKLSYEIQSMDNENEHKTVHSRGEIYHNKPGDNKVEQRLSIEDIKARCSHSLDKETIYSTFKERGILYGDYYQGLNQLWVNEEEALGYLQLPKEYEKELSCYTLHPTLADGALQAIIGISTGHGRESKKTRLAFAIEETEILHSLKARGYSYVKKTGQDRYHVSILDETGRVCVKLEDVALRELKDSEEGQTPDCYVRGTSSIIETALETVKLPFMESSNLLKLEQSYGEMTRFCHCLLLDAFREMEVFRHKNEHYDKETLKKQLKIIPGYLRLYDVLLDMMARAKFIGFKDNGQDLFTTSELENPGLSNELETLKDRKNELANHAGISSHITLLCACLERLPDILRGDIPATEVMFPNSKVDMVESIYRGNEIADFYNHLVVDSVVSYIRARLPSLNKDEKIKILEIGAGTGGTSAVVFDAIRCHSEKLNYVYTDISLGFTRYGKKQYGTENPFVEFKLLDIEKEVTGQGYAPGDFDIVIATNVLHATRNIRNTLGNLNVLLKTNGWLIANEMTGNLDFLTLTFGLLDGWWLFEDEEIRLPGSPLLAANTWKQILKEEGFDKVFLQGKPVEKSKIGSQHVIIAESGGRSKRNMESSGKTAAVKQLQVIKPAASPGSNSLDPPVSGTPKHSNIDTEELRQHIKNKIIEDIIDILEVSRNDLNLEKQFSEYGVDSFIGVELVNKINEDLGIKLRTTALFDHGNVTDLTDFICSRFGMNLAPTFSLKSYRESDISDTGKDLEETAYPGEIHKTPILIKHGGLDIAIIGISCRFAGARDAEEYWHNLARGKCSIIEVPKGRWDMDIYYDPDNERLDRTNCKWGGFLDDIDLFDPLFFNISGKEAELADPQQRLFLEECWKALEDSGYANESISGARCGVFVGTIGGDYQIKTEEEGAALDAYSALGNFYSILGGRISYFLNLKGPNITVDTACSSSLTAIHLGCQSILNGESDMAAAGGVFVAVTPRFYILNSNLGALSHEGRCRTFDNNANGFVPGEGVGVVILKSLESALEDGDHIYGVIKGSGMNQDGKTNGITAPSSISQTNLELSVYEKFGINPESITLVEAHGTGTKLGDPIEVEALTDAYRKYTPRKQYCAIGSVKSNIGHTVAAAGVAGVIKILMAFKHKQIPPSVNFNTPNEHIDFHNSPFYVNTSLREWKTGGTYPRRATVSAFGFSGTNAHLVIEEAPAWERNQNPMQNKEPQVMLLSAKTPQSLKTYAARIIDHLEKTQDVRLEDISYTLNVGRRAMEERLAIVTSGVPGMKEKLNQYCHDKTEVEGIYTGNVNNNPSGIDFLMEGEEGKEIVRHLIKNKKLNKLAMMWVSGAKIDWNLLYPPNTGRRVSLPTYPFTRERYWITPREESATQASNRIESPEMLYYYPDWEKTDPVPGMNKIEKAKETTGYILVLGRNEQVWEDNPRVILVKPGKGYRKIRNRIYQIDPGCGEDYSQLLEELKTKNILPASLVHLWAIDSVTGGNCDSHQDDLSQDNTAEFLTNGIYSIYHLIRAISHKGVRFRRLNRVVFVYSSGAPFSALDPKLNPVPYMEALAGYCSSLAFVLPDLVFSTVEVMTEAIAVDEKSAGDIALQELDIQDKNHEVLYKGTHRNRYIKKMKPLDLSRAGERKGVPVLLKKRGVYLVTGGAGELGLIFARHLAQNYQARIVLVGRSKLTTKKKEQLEELERIGSGILYLQADVSNRQDMEVVIETIKQRFDHLNGLIHAAGILDNRKLLEKEMSEFEAAFISKVQGTIVLDEVTRDEPLDFFVLFSSASSMLGDFGQCDYAVANRFMDAFVKVREELKTRKLRQGRTLAINWPLWREGGMRPGNENETFYLRSTGMIYLETRNGLEAFDKILNSDNSQVMVTAGQKSKVNRLLGIEKKETGEMPGNIRNANPVKAEMTPIEQRLTADIRKITSAILRIDVDKLEVTGNFGTYGFDSISLKDFAVQLRKTYGIQVGPTIFYAHSTITSLSKYLLREFAENLKQHYTIPGNTPGTEPGEPKNKYEYAHESMESKVEGSEAEELPESGVDTTNAAPVMQMQKEPVAIIGVSGIFPGSGNPEEFWDNLVLERDLITEVPPDRWDWRDYYSEGKPEENKSISKWGGFISDIDKFDAHFFNISPMEAEMMDPQHRLFLQTAWQVLEDAGYRASQFSGRNIGVFVGVQVAEYQGLLENAGNLRAQVITGNTHTMLCNRVSYFLNFRGPSESIDTACSSSLVAIHRAVRSIQDKESELAIAGGVSLMITPQNQVITSQMGILSPGGRCKTFDKNADGYVKGEGVGALLLKPLGRAIEDHDHIYAVIKGTAVNHGGKATSPTAPNSEAQAQLLAAAFDDAGIHPGSISYIEAHGTGTELGDPVEIEGMKKAFEEYSLKRKQPIHRTQYCGLGSVKTNIGHLEPAAGIAGITKVILAMKHRKLPGLVHFRELNPYIQLENTPFYLVNKTDSWEQLVNRQGQKIPRRAGVSSFGFGGTNAHIVLEEYPGQAVEPDVKNRGPHLIVLSARDEDRLREYAGNIFNFLGRIKDANALQKRQNIGNGLLQKIQTGLLEIITAIAAVNRNDIDIEENFSEYGFDPVNLAELTDYIYETYHLEISPAIFQGITSLAALSRFLYLEYSDVLQSYYGERIEAVEIMEPGHGEHSSEYPSKYDLNLERIAYTLQLGRECMEERLALVVNDLDQLKNKLEEYSGSRNAGKDIENLYVGNVKTNKEKSELIKGEAGREFVRLLIKERDVIQLARLWVCGVDIDWEKLYPSPPPKRISLPTYPFARERHWIKEIPTTKYRCAYDGNKQFHPLIERFNAGQSLNQGIVLEKTLGPGDMIVSEHRILGKPLLPGVAHLEMAYAAASMTGINNSICTGLAKIVWLRPLELKDSKKQVRITMDGENTNRMLKYEIQSIDNDNGRPTVPTVHSRGEIHFDFENKSGRGINRRLSIEEIKARCPGSIEGEALYAGFGKMGIDYGRYFRGVVRVWFNTNQEEAIGELSLPVEYERELAHYTFHPCLTDSAFQTIMAIANGGDLPGQKPMVPFAIEKAEVFHPLKAHMYAYAKAVGGNKFHVVLMDEDGRVCIKFHELALRELNDGISIPDFFYIPVWKPCQLPLEHTGLATPGKSRVLMVHTSRGMELEKALVDVHKGQGNEVIEADLDSGDADAFENLIHSMDTIHMIYFLGGIQEKHIDILDLEALDKSQELGVISLFRLVKTLSRHGFTQQKLILKVITNDVHVVNPETSASINPHGASLHGLVRSMAKEYPKWEMACIDVSIEEIKANSQKMQALVRQILEETGQPDRGEIVLREGKRWIRSLHALRFPSPPTKLPLLRSRGVYVILGGAGGIGLEMGLYLAKNLKAQLALIGRTDRSQLNHLQKEKVAQIEAEGGEVLYIQAEATDLESMNRAAQEVKSHFGKVNGAIHSAIVLKDKLLDNMDEATFRSVLAPKIRGSAVLHYVFRQESLDFMMFFSSAQSFIGNPGQSNYAAACTFKDAFALHLHRVKSYPVQIINWGYWGSVGIVATEAYNKRLAAQGMQSIPPAQGMEAIQQVLSNDVTQLIALKANPHILEKIGVDTQHYIRQYSQHMTSIIRDIVTPIKEELSRDYEAHTAAFHETFGKTERFGQRLLLQTFRQMKVFCRGGEQYDKEELRQQLGIIPAYFRLFEALLDILVRAGFIQINGRLVMGSQQLDQPGMQKKPEELEAEKQRLTSENPGIEPYINLMWVCLKAYPDVLTGRKSHMEVMFPGGSGHLVEGIYKGNRIIDYYNRMVAKIVRHFIELRLRENPNAQVHILELGAGTGGTSVFAMEEIEQYHHNIRYYYTDISAGFTRYGGEKYGETFSFAVFRVLDIEKFPGKQGFKEGSIDLVFASNVLHAVQQMDNALEQAKKLLKANGLLVINEIMQVWDFATLTFGLTDGWWHFKDEDKRLNNSPLLSPGHWKDLLESNGFRKVNILGADSIGKKGEGILQKEQGMQGIIVGESDGLVRIPIQLPAPAAVVSNPAAVSESTASSGNLRENTLEYAIGIFSKVLKLEKDKIDSRITFEHFGVDSLVALEINREFGKDFEKLPTTMLFEHTTIEALTDYFIENHPDRIEQITGMTYAGAEEKKPKNQAPFRPGELAGVLGKANEEEIAIIGLAGRYPRSPTLDLYWNNLKNGRNCISDIPIDRWDWTKYQHNEKLSHHRWGGFIQDADAFDSLFFNISPAEAEGMDPQERLFMETAWTVLEDAGVTGKTLVDREEKVGVFVGVMNRDYDWVGAAGSAAGQGIHAHSYFWSIANRVSYFFDFQGPSLAIDTACSSSLTALHLACESIKKGECAAALAGGVNLILHPIHYQALSRMNMLSGDEKCKSFGDNADGFVVGEGVGAVLLKPLDRAIQDGNRIYAVIKGSSINAGGKTGGYMVPNPNAQANLVSEALKKARINPDTVSYFEAQANGSCLGDSIEISGLVKAFSQSSNPLCKQYCSIGSVKSNIGHLESASGIAGVTKVLLQLKHKQLVPSIHSEPLNPNIDFRESPFYVQQETAEWKQPVLIENETKKTYPRRAGISSFGAGGANAHVVLEEYPENNKKPENKKFLRGSRGQFFQKEPPGRRRQEELILISAKNEERLKAYARELADYLEKCHQNLLLEDIAYTLQVGRESMAERLALVVISIESLREKLNRFYQGKKEPDNFSRDNVKKNRKKTGPVKENTRDIIEERDLHQLAQLWVSGVEIDWEFLYDKYIPGPKRISLPTYPFARNRFRLQVPENRIEEIKRTTKIHPLIDINTSTLNQQQYATHLTGEEFWLADHIVAGRKTLPGVVYIEMARAAAEMAGEGKIQKIKNIIWAKPIVLENSAVDVHLSLYAGEVDGNTVEYEVRTGSQENPRMVHARGKLDYENQPGKRQGGQYKPIDIDVVKKRCSHNMNSDECYGYFREMGLHYGVSFRSIRQLYYNETECLSELELPQECQDEFREFVLHPSLLDGALQTVMGLTLNTDRESGVLLIPFTLDEMEILGALTERCYAYARPTGDKADRGLKKYNVYILDPSGNVLVMMKHFSVRALRQQLEHSPVNRIFYCRNMWEESLVPLYPGKDNTVEDIAKHEHIVLFAGRENRGSLLPLKERAAKVTLVIPGESYQCSGDGVYTINPSRPGDYRQMLASLKKQSILPGKIIHMWLWEYEHFAVDEVSLQVQLEKGIYSLFYLSQAMMAERPTEKVRLLAVYPAHREGASPLHTALGGFARTIQQENPKFIYKTIEIQTLPEGQSMHLARLLEVLLREFTAGADTDKEIEIRYLSGEKRRLVKRIEEFDPDETGGKPKPLKKKGVYLITGGIGGLGLIFARYLAGQVMARLVLTDRVDLKDLSDEIKEKIKELETLGSEVFYIKADISRRQEVEHLIEQTRRRFKVLNGILHCAGITRDAVIPGKTSEEIDAVLAPKVYGTIWLDEATKKESPDFFVMFSSIIGLIGNSGQCDYAFGNSFMDNYALMKAKQNKGRKFLSINWPLWKDGGMKIDHRVKIRVEKKAGLMTLETAVGLEAFEKFLALDPGQAAVITGDRAKLIRGLGIKSINEPDFNENQTVPVSKLELQLHEKVEKELVRICSELLKVKASDLDIEDELGDYGLDSIMMMAMLNRLEEIYGEVMEPNSLVEHNTIKKLATHLIGQGIVNVRAGTSGDKGLKPLQEMDIDKYPELKKIMAGKVAGNPRRLRSKGISLPIGKEKIAIIGMACRFPQSNSPERFWDNLEKGKNLVSEVPGDRWKISGYYDPDKNAENKTYSKWGGFIDNVYSFDADYFGVSEADALVMDPQHRILLELTEELFCRAGFGRQEMSNTRTGIYIGGGESTYVKKNTGEIPGIYMRHLMVNTIQNMMAARISDFYNLKGPSHIIDTACSSSMVAIHQACQAIRAGDCNMAIAGGIELLIDPYLHIGFSKAEVLSDEGVYYVFDERSKGFVLGEGAGLVLLKSYGEAAADGDNILGVISGSAVNNDGHTMGLTVPSLEGQKEVIRQALENSGVTAEQISYMEAHGTGTLLGDPIEIKAATQVYREFTREKQFCGVGSVKSNMGHLMRAGAMASFIKVVLALQHRKIPPTINCMRPHPRFQFETSPFYPVTQLKKWLPGNEKKFAAVSAFGFGGTNCHMILEEFMHKEPYIKKRNVLPITQFKRKYYCLGREITGETGTGNMFDGILLAKLLRDLKTGKIDSEKAMELIGLDDEAMLLEGDIR